MKTQEIIKTITELNNELYEDSPQLYDNGLGYIYLTDGFIDIVKFNDYVVYNSEDYSEEYVKEVIGFKELFIAERNKYIGMLTKIRIS